MEPRERWVTLLTVLHPVVVLLALLPVVRWLLSLPGPVLSFLALPVVTLLLLGLGSELLRQLGFRLVFLYALRSDTVSVRGVWPFAGFLVAAYEVLAAAGVLALLSTVLVHSLARVTDGHPWLLLLIAVYCVWWIVSAGTTLSSSLKLLAAERRPTP